MATNEGDSGQAANFSRRTRLIEKEISKYCKKAEQQELEKEMRQEGKDALKIAALKLAYRKKYYDMSNDKFKVFPSVLSCLAQHKIYEEAEKYYYDPEDEFPLKYTAALREIALAAGGAEEDGDVVETMAQDVDSDDEAFALKQSMREKLVDGEILKYCKIAEEQELDKEMREEGKKALKIAANKLAYQKKYYDMSNDKFKVFPSVLSCLAQHEIYEEAEKYYYDPEDEFPLKYTAALKDIALAKGGGEEDDGVVETMTEDVDSDDEAFVTLTGGEAPIKSGGGMETQNVKTETADTGSNDNAESVRKNMIEEEISKYCKLAEEQELEKEMRDEGKTALKIAAYKLAYRKKYYDMTKDEFRLFPSVLNCLAHHEIYEEAEKYFYDPEDEFPLKYIAALREIALANGGAEANDGISEEMAQEVGSDDEAFVALATGGGEKDPGIMNTKDTDVKDLDNIPDPGANKERSRKKIIEKEILKYCKLAEERELEKEMRQEGKDALKIAALKLAYRKKYYDMSNDRFKVFPSVLSCLAQHKIYEEAEKYYYDPEDEFPLKYTAALREIALARGGAEEDGDVVETMAQDVDSDDEAFEIKPSKRERLVDEEILKYCKIAEEQELDKEMREEGKKALKIAANKLAYQKKYYDMSNDKFKVFPSVLSCLAQHEIYEEAEKYYYDPEDEFPLKYTAALKDIALAKGGGEEDDGVVETMAEYVESDDEAFPDN